ncbi:MAG: penicillin-binding protein 2 [bacterium]
MDKLFESTDTFASGIRKKLFFAVIILFAVAYIGKLAQLQLSSSQYSEQSRAQAVKKNKIVPSRGNMYDRNGQLIVYNDVLFSITVTPIDFREHSLPLLSQITGLSPKLIKYKIYKSKRGFTKFAPIKIIDSAAFSIVSQIEEFSDYLPGVEVKPESKRKYNLPCHLAHVLGYTREITEQQLKQSPYYGMGDIIGQSGVESTYEDILRGKDGFNFFTINKFGEKVQALGIEKMQVPAVNGSDLYLTIDLDLQKRAEALLRGRRGAVVVIDPNNGDVLAMASAPDFDVQKFSGKIDREYLSKLYADKNKPLFNRAISARYPPGSTWKMMTALAGMGENIITENTPILCTGGYKMGTKILPCHGVHGNVSVRNALKASCNSYFGKLGVKLGFKNFYKWATYFNFGQVTGIDIAGESRGLLPSEEFLKKRYGKFATVQGRLANFGIGQGEILVTPLQMAVYVSAIANGGLLIQPHVVGYLKNHFSGKLEMLNYQVTRLPLTRTSINAVKEGMYRVVNSGGTGGSAAIGGKNVCGKTGTAQNPHGASHSWFVCFAPMDKPTIAIAVLVENAGAGADVAAPIARELMMQHFYPTYYNTGETANTIDTTATGAINYEN